MLGAVIAFVAYLIILYIFSRPPQPQEPLMNIDGMSRAAYRLNEKENGYYTIITTSREVYYESYHSVAAEKLQIDKVVAFDHGDGIHWRYYASFNGFPPEEWLIEAGNVDLLNGDLTDVSVTILKSVEILEIPQEILDLIP